MRNILEGSFLLGFGYLRKNADNADAPTAQRPVALAFGELLPQPLCGRKSREARRDSRHEQTEGLRKARERQRLSLEHDRMACDRRAARSDASHERIVRFAKVRFGSFAWFIFHLFSCMASDFSHFSDKNALSYRAVRGLYSRRLNHKMPGVMTRSN